MFEIGDVLKHRRADNCQGCRAKVIAINCDMYTYEWWCEIPCSTPSTRQFTYEGYVLHDICEVHTDAFTTWVNELRQTTENTTS